MSKTWSLTVGNGGENHAGMELIGNIRKNGEGWNLEKLIQAKSVLETFFDKNVELINLNEQCINDIEIPLSKKPKDAYLMIVRNFLSDDKHLQYKEELESYEWDRKYYDTRRQKVLNKRARANVCYGPKTIEPDYENKKGTIIGYDKSPLVFKLKLFIEMLMKDKDLIVEGNQYDNCNKNGIGPHGDSERVCVACLRVGAMMPMKFGMFYRNTIQGKSFTININGGDLYFMNEEAVGSQWKSSSKWIWRHAAGAPKYLVMKGE